MRRGPLTLAVLATAFVAPPGQAEAAKLKVGGGPVAVGTDDIAKIKVVNRTGSVARGKVTLRALGGSVGSRRFTVRKRKSKNVAVPLTAAGSRLLQQSGSLKVQAVVTAKGMRKARKSITLVGAGGGTQQGTTSPGGAQPGPSAPWRGGRWQGTYFENGTDLAFNVRDTRLFTGPFDAFYLEATCQDSDNTDATAMEPIEATISPDGRFFGQGQYRPGAGMVINWTVKGTIAGERITGGEFSATYTDYYGKPCSGTTRFTANWYGDYEL